MENLQKKKMTDQNLFMERKSKLLWANSES
jgi:hypothetical protein